MIRIHSDFDGGNVEVVSIDRPDDVRLRIRKDAGAEHLQWFSFRVAGARGVPLVLRLINAGDASYPEGWDGYAAVVSSDRRTWRRASTTYAEGVLSIEVTPTQDVLWVAYFAPYSAEQHFDLIARCLPHPRVRVEPLGSTLDGAPLDCLTLGEPEEAGKKVVWVIARQHPGETMAAHFMDGFLERLLDDDDGVSRDVLERAVVYAIPNMNPDGARRGHLRTNAVGANLNREWQEPTMERSPEVFLTRARMVETGVDLCLDVHGDEALPYNFIAGPDGIPTIRPGQLELVEKFKADLAARNPDFQVAHGYERSPPGQANLTMCTNWVGERFGCPAMTLEMPFKDTADSPRPDEGWSPPRCRLLARSTVESIRSLLAAL